MARQSRVGDAPGLGCWSRWAAVMVGSAAVLGTGGCFGERKVCTLVFVTSGLKVQFATPLEVSPSATLEIEGSATHCVSPVDPASTGATQPSKGSAGATGAPDLSLGGMGGQLSSPGRAGSVGNSAPTHCVWGGVTCQSNTGDGRGLSGDCLELTVGASPAPGTLGQLQGFKIDFSPYEREQFYRQLTYRVVDQGKVLKSGTLSVTYPLHEPNGLGCGYTAFATVTD